MAILESSRLAGGTGRSHEPAIDHDGGGDPGRGLAASRSQAAAGGAAGHPRGAHPGRSPAPAFHLRPQRHPGAQGQSVPEPAQLRLGPDPLDDRTGGDPLGPGAALGGFLDHPHPAGGQRPGGLLGGEPGRQRRGGPQGPPGPAGPRAQRRRLDLAGGPGAGAGGCGAPAAGRDRAGRCPPAGRRRPGGGPVRPHRRIPAGRHRRGGGDLLRLDRPPGGSRCPGVRHGRAHLFRRHGPADAGEAGRQPFPAGRARRSATC